MLMIMRTDHRRLNVMGTADFPCTAGFINKRVTPGPRTFSLTIVSIITTPTDFVLVNVP